MEHFWDRKPWLEESVMDFGHPLAPDILCTLINEGAGGTVYDISGRDNHGTLTDMDPDTDWRGGPDGWVLDFDGSNDYIAFPPVFNDFPDQPFTFVFRTLFASVADNDYFWQEPGTRGYMDARAAGTVSYDHYPPSGQFSTSSASLFALNTWTDIGVVKTAAGGITWYSNGRAWGTASHTETYVGSAPTEAQLMVGCAGQVSRVYIYSRDLVAAEMAKVTAQPYCFIYRDPMHWLSALGEEAVVGTPYYYRRRRVA